MSEVQAMKELKDIAKVKAYLAKKSARDYALFVVGINVGLRASDLLSLTAGMVFDEEKKVRKEVTLREKKTGKRREIHFNPAAAKVLEEYCRTAGLTGEDYLFPSRKGKNRPLTVRSLNHMVKEWCKECRIKGNFGTHTLRKTFGYHLYANHAADPFILPHLMRIFNHSSQAVTLRYIGIERSDLIELYEDLNL